MTIKQIGKALICCVIMISQPTFANEWMVNAGGGPQPNGKGQTNLSAGIDYSFAKWVRSYRQHMLFGISATYLAADSEENDEIWAISLYPQLTLYAPTKEYGQPYFFVRALGPSYISSNNLGNRQQAEHFSFQAQVGVGLYIPTRGDEKIIAAVSFKHFSNANIFSENDGIDLPVMLNLGMSL
ncbi:MAG: acyloxyacyl hydrolase [Pseudomonadales bacterium]|nr:acyloxyacyl hydrolase [Pseudomonadales bacterium]